MKFIIQQRKGNKGERMTKHKRKYRVWGIALIYIRDSDKRIKLIADSCIAFTRKEAIQTAMEWHDSQIELGYTLKKCQAHPQNDDDLLLYIKNRLS